MEMKPSVLETATIPDKLPVIEKKASSTSSLYISSTISTPSIKSILSAVANFMSAQISSEPTVGPGMLSNPDLIYFSEEKYIVENPEAFGEELKQVLRTPPSKENIVEFVGALYDCAQFRYIKGSHILL